VYNVALTGGIAAGKSVVARRLVELGAVLIDADVLAREVVEPGTPGLAAIRDRFGEGVLAPDGSLDRAALGAIVFADADALADLNAITHPAIRVRRRELMAGAGEHDVLVHDIPLLVEGVAGRPPGYDAIVVVHADHDERVRRMVEDRGMTPEDAERRIAAQATEERRLEVADVVIDNTGDLRRTLEQVDRFWSGIPRS
jgi:dephospho-CoA kinase